GVDPARAGDEVALDVAAAAVALALVAGARAGALAGPHAGAGAGAKPHRSLGQRVALDAGELRQAGRQVAVDDVVEDLAVLVLEELDLGRLGRDILGVGVAGPLGVALAAG